MRSDRSKRNYAPALAILLPVLFALLLVILPGKTDHPEPELFILFLFTIIVLPMLGVLLILGTITWVLLTRRGPSAKRASFGWTIMVISLVIGTLAAGIILIAHVVVPCLSLALVGWLIVATVVEACFFAARKLARSSQHHDRVAQTEPAI